MRRGQIKIVVLVGLVLSAASSLAVAVPVARNAVTFAAEGDLTSLSGGAGWVGAGLLGLVLGWLLLVHLPAKDKQFKDLVEGRDQLAKDMTQRFDEHVKGLVEVSHGAVKEARLDFKEVLALMGSAHERQMAGMTAAMHQDLEALGMSVDGLTKAVDEMRAKGRA